MESELESESICSGRSQSRIKFVGSAAMTIAKNDGSRNDGNIIAAKEFISKSYSLR